MAGPVFLYFITHYLKEVIKGHYCISNAKQQQLVISCLGVITTAQY
jgi:hypothetical protein